MLFRKQIKSVPDVRTKIGKVIRIDNGALDVMTVGGSAPIKGIRCAGGSPAVNDWVMISFYKNNEIIATPIAAQESGSGTGNTTIISTSPSIIQSTTSFLPGLGLATDGSGYTNVQIVSGRTQINSNRVDVSTLLLPTPTERGHFLVSNASGGSTWSKRVYMPDDDTLWIQDSTLQPVIILDGSANSYFALPMSLGLSGGIYQGTGTFVSPTTGLKIWNDTGIGRIAGYNSGVTQWNADTDGKFYAGTGNVKIDSDGITLSKNSGATSAASIKWLDTDTKIVGYTFLGWNRMDLTNQKTSAFGVAVTTIEAVGGTGGTGSLILRGYGDGIEKKITIASNADGIDFVGSLSFTPTNTYDIGTGANPRNINADGYFSGASLKLKGAGAGYNTFSPPSIGSNITHTLPSVAGTLAQLGDITGALSGTTGTIPKFTGTNAIGNSIITESGAAISVAGTVASTGTYIGVATSPGSIELQRSLQRTSGYYIELGTFTSGIGTHNLRITLSVDQAGLSFARQWLVSTVYAQTAGAWWFVPPTTDSSDGSGECFLAINQTTNGLTMRLVYNGGPGSSYTHYVRVENIGNMSESFSATSASGSGMTVPTTPLTTGLMWQTRALQLVKTIPTTVGNYVEIGYFSITNGGNVVKVSISNSDGSFVVSKTYVIPMAYNEAGSWCIVGADHDTGSYSSNDWELVALQSNQNLLLRLLRTVGTTAGTAYVTLQCEGPLATSAWVPQTGTGSMSVPTIYHPECLLTQKDGGAIVRGGYLSGDMDTMTYAATITLTVTAGNLHKTTTVHATGNATINASGVGVAGQHIWVLIVNDATGGKVITFGTNFKPNGTLTGTISKGAIVEFVSDGASWWEVSRTLVL